MSRFVGILPGGIQEAARELPDDTFKVFLVMLSHADMLGQCFPGFLLLAEESQKRVETTHAHVQALISLNYVRIVRKGGRDRFGVWTPQVYQICPRFVHIPKELLPEAITIWQSLEQNIEQIVPSGKVEAKGGIESAESEAIQNQESESRISSSSSRNPENALSAVSSAAVQSPARPTPTATHNSTKNGKQQQEQPVAAMRPPSSAAPPRPGKYPDLKPVSQPFLTNDEQLAIDAHEITGIKLEMARGLIAEYSGLSVYAALSDPFLRDAKNRVSVLRFIVQLQGSQVTDEHRENYRIHYAGYYAPTPLGG
jgi:hypothetical protein